jgi:hypothetical protein
MTAASEDVHPLGRRGSVVKACAWEREDVIAVAVKHRQGGTEARHCADAWIAVGDQERRGERMVVAGEVPGCS